MHDPQQSQDPERSPGAVDIPGLDALAQYGERCADPPPVEQIRARGDRRRRRRHTAVGAGALAAVLLVGGVLVGGSSLLDGNRVPDPAQPPSAAPQTREVGPENLVPAAEVPHDERIARVEPADGTRGPDDLSVCQQGSLSELGPTSTAWSGYTLLRPGGFDDDHPLADEPNLITAALQFDTEAAATEAMDRYRGWLDECPEHLRAQGYGPKEDGDQLREITWYDVPVEGAEAGFAEQIYTRPDAAGTPNGWFEGVALAVSGDRLLVAVHLAYGPEYYWSPPGESDPAMPGPHPLEQLLPVAVEYLDAD